MEISFAAYSADTSLSLFLISMISLVSTVNKPSSNIPGGSRGSLRISRTVLVELSKLRQVSSSLNRVEDRKVERGWNRCRNCCTVRILNWREISSLLCSGLEMMVAGTSGDEGMVR
jgi:hypothetical protein